MGDQPSVQAVPGPLLVHADLHNHTWLSDGAGDPALAFACMRAAGLDVAAITDHSRPASAFLGLLSVTDEHGADRGCPDGKGRAGLYVRELSRAGVLEVLAARRFFASRVKGLRVDACRACRRRSTCACRAPTSR